MYVYPFFDFLKFLYFVGDGKRKGEESERLPLVNLVKSKKKTAKYKTL